MPPLSIPGGSARQSSCCSYHPRREELISLDIRGQRDTWGGWSLRITHCCHLLSPSPSLHDLNCKFGRLKSGKNLHWTKFVERTKMNLLEHCQKDNLLPSSPSDLWNIRLDFLNENNEWLRGSLKGPHANPCLEILWAITCQNSPATGKVEGHTHCNAAESSLLSAYSRWAVSSTHSCDSCYHP